MGNCNMAKNVREMSGNFTLLDSDHPAAAAAAAADDDDMTMIHTRVVGAGLTRSLFQTHCWISDPMLHQTDPTAIKSSRHLYFRAFRDWIRSSLTSGLGHRSGTRFSKKI